jgi:hypothetical protein
MILIRLSTGFPLLYPFDDLADLSLEIGGVFQTAEGGIMAAADSGDVEAGK